MQSSLLLVCLLPSLNHTSDSNEPYQLTAFSLTSPSTLVFFLDMAFSIQPPPLPFRCTSAPALSFSPYFSLPLSLSTSPLSPPYLTSVYVCVCVSPRPCSLPGFLLSSRCACCTALRRRQSWSSKPPGPPVRPGPRTCGSPWGRLSQV